MTHPSKPPITNAAMTIIYAGYEFTGELAPLYDASQLELYEPRGRNQGTEWRWKRSYCEKMLEMCTAMEVAERMSEEATEPEWIWAVQKTGRLSRYVRARLNWERHLAIARSHPRP